MPYERRVFHVNTVASRGYGPKLVSIVVVIATITHRSDRARSVTARAIQASAVADHREILPRGDPKTVRCASAERCVFGVVLCVLGCVWVWGWV